MHDQLEWMRASLDGLSFDGSTVLEIKCPINVRDQSAAKQGHVAKSSLRSARFKAQNSDMASKT